MITGATDGIGLELAKLYRDQGHRLILLGRRALDTLESHPSGLFGAHNYVPADLGSDDFLDEILQGLEALGVSELDLVIHLSLIHI